ncbi:MAG TPA: M56 family metallopeptidase, partial [Gemmatimonadaceae bacterium]|nr:M56 family metallopeptidase [Gemmatimonadaceae bacterium]
MIRYANIIADYLVSLPFPALLILKSSIVLMAGALIAILLHRSAASMRYAVWALALSAIIVLPFGMLAAPPLAVRIARAPDVVENFSFDPVTVAPSGSTITNTIHSDNPQSMRLDLSGEQKLLLLWLAGSVLLLGRMVIARISLARLTRKSSLLDNAEWTGFVLRESFHLGIERRIRLFASDRVSTPLAAGVTDAFIILPSSASEWTDGHKEIVLRHELSHIARGDALVCVLSGIACALYWFNPLVWIASRKLRAEQERACDDSVITLGTPPVEYASHLLEVARSARNIGMSSFVSVAMARPSQLEGRLLAVLNNRRRNSLTRTRRAGTVMVALLLLLGVSALRPMRAESAVIVASQTAPVFVTAALPESEHKVARDDSTVTGDVKVE